MLRGPDASIFSLVVDTQSHSGGQPLPYSETDRKLLERCLAREAFAWESFVDRFMPVIVHVINQSAGSRNIELDNADREDMVADVFLALAQNDFAALKRFKGRSALATYIAVIARRIVIRLIGAYLRRVGDTTLVNEPEDKSVELPHFENREQVESLLKSLNDIEAILIKLAFLENKSYQQIHEETGISLNSIGATISRAKSKLAKATSVAPKEKPVS